MREIFFWFLIVLAVFVVGCSAMPNEINFAIRSDEEFMVNGYQVDTKWNLK